MLKYFILKFKQVSVVFIKNQSKHRQNVHNMLRRWKPLIHFSIPYKVPNKSFNFFFLTLSGMPFISISNPQNIFHYYSFICVSKFSAFPNLYTIFHSIKDVLPNFIIVNIIANEWLIIFGYMLYYFCSCILNCLYESKISFYIYICILFCVFIIHSVCIEILLYITLILK
jgi:hypothetical protein